MRSALQDEFDYYVENQEEIVRQYNGKVVVIKDRQIIGVFDSVIDSVNETKKVHPLGTFLVQEVAPGTASYTQTFASRVVFHQ